MKRYNRVSRNLWAGRGMTTLGDMPFSLHALYLYLMTCDRPTRVAGLLRGVATICDDTGWGFDTVSEGVSELHRMGLLTVSDRPSYILVHEALAFDLPDPGKATIGALRAIEELPDVPPVSMARAIIEARGIDTVSYTVPPTHAIPESREQGAESREQDQKNTVPDGARQFVLAPVEDESAKPKPKPKSPVQQVWDGYIDGRSNQRKSPGSDATKRISVSLKEYSVEELIAVSQWILLAPDDYCRRMREIGYTTYSTIYKPTGMQDRVDKAMAWAAAGKSTVTATEAADHDGWWAENGARWLRDAREFSMVWRQTKGEFGVDLRTVEDVVRFVHAGGTKQAARKPDVVKPPPPVDWLRPKVTPLALEIPWVSA